MYHMKIAVYECEDWQEEYLRDRLEEHEVVFIHDTLSVTNVPADAEALIVFIWSQVTKEVLDVASNVRFVATMSTGFDHIDIEACKERNIVVSSVPFYGENTVAEHTFALLLTISRNILPSVQRVKGGTFNPQGLRGWDLKGKTLGVIGTGSIGRHVIKMARSFEMPVLAFDPFPKEGLDNELGFSYVGLDHLLAHSDIVTLHCPYNEHTHHLLNDHNLSFIKQGAVVINTARGGLIDSAALLRALQEGRVSAAGLDVLEEEASIREEYQVLSPHFHQQGNLHRVVLEHVLIHHPRVIVTPHNAFNSIEALERILDTTIENLHGFVRGQPINTVN